MNHTDDNNQTLVLGDEYDQSIRDRLVNVLNDLGAVQKKLTSGVGGSQDIEIIEYIIANENLVVESETYVGLSIFGSKSLTEKIAAACKG